MNTLFRDRNTLRRLVESYGKKDVLNFVKHLNESVGYQHQFFGIVHHDMLWNLVNEPEETYDWMEKDEWPYHNPKVQRALEKIYAPGKVQVVVDAVDEGDWEGESQELFKVIFNFNDDLTQDEASGILYDFALINGNLEKKYNNGTITLNDIRKNKIQPRTIFGVTDYQPVYGGDCTDLAELAGIK